MMQEIIDGAINGGIPVACVAYLMYFQLSVMNKMTDTLNNINISITELNAKIDALSEKVGG